MRSLYAASDFRIVWHLRLPTPALHLQCIQGGCAAEYDRRGGQQVFRRQSLGAGHFHHAGSGAVPVCQRLGPASSSRLHRRYHPLRRGSCGGTAHHSVAQFGAQTNDIKVVGLWDDFNNQQNVPTKEVPIETKSYSDIVVWEKIWRKHDAKFG